MGESCYLPLPWPLLSNKVNPFSVPINKLTPVTKKNVKDIFKDNENSQGKKKKKKTDMYKDECGFSLFIYWHINPRGLIITKAIIVEEQQWYHLTHSWGDKWGSYPFQGY